MRIGMLVNDAVVEFVNLLRIFETISKCKFSMTWYVIHV